MQLDKALQLRRAWGDKPCAHPTLDKEYYLGSSTGDYVCTTCGKNFSREEAQQHREQQSADAQS